jgi:superfamily II DNA helicase RecQ
LNSKCHAQTLTVHAIFLGGESDDVIRDGGVDIIFASPEMILGSKTWREEMQNFDVKVIVVDEFHTVATWYVI